MKQLARILLLQCMFHCSYAFQSFTPNNNPPSETTAGNIRHFLIGQYQRQYVRRFMSNQDRIEVAEEENPLILQAKKIVQSNLGIDDNDLLADEQSSFVWIHPCIDEPVGKDDYVAAGRYFHLPSAFPDLDFRAYDFRVDADDSFTIRCTCRLIGTLQGKFLQLKNHKVPPNGRIMVCPPEGISMTFDPVTMKVTKLCTGFCLDRQVGNTNGHTGIQAASIIAGTPMVDVILADDDTRPKRLENPTSGGKSPFPPTVMVQLARGVLSSNLGADDPSLLSDDEFCFLTPSIGPIGKADFLRHYAEQEFEGYDLNFSNLRVDPYEPDRVWMDARPTAPGFQGPPQVLSCSFDKSGCCCRITTSAVLDSSVGNAGGLGGAEGFKYAMDNASVEPALWSDDDEMSSEQMYPLLNVNDMDDSEAIEDEPVKQSAPFEAKINGVMQSKEPARPAIPPPIEKMQVLEDETKISNDVKIKTTQDVEDAFGAIPKKFVESFTSLPTGTISVRNKSSGSTSANESRRIEPKKAKEPAATTKSPVKKPATGSNRLSLGDFTDSIRIPDFNFHTSQEDRSDGPNSKKADIDNSVVKRLESLKEMTDSIRIVPENISRSFSLLIDQKTQEEKAAAESRRRAATNKRAAELKRIVEQKQEQPKHTAEEAKLALARKIQAERRERMNRDDLLARARARRDAERRKGMVSDSSFASTLFGLKDTSMITTSVPKLARWRRNPDGTITGLITGSANYKRNEKVTTSPVKRGKVASGEVIQTGSGSRYYLE